MPDGPCVRRHWDGHWDGYYDRFGFIVLANDEMKQGSHERSWQQKRGNKR